MVAFKADVCCPVPPICGGPITEFGIYNNPIFQSLNSGKFILHKGRSKGFQK